MFGKKNKIDDNFIIETNRKCYDNLGELYTDGKDDLQTLVEIGVWDEFIDSLSGKKVLDVGCGAGDVANKLASDGFDVTACDLSAAMIESVKKKAAGVRALVLGATELEKIGSERFDGIVAIHLVQHLSKTMLKKFFDSVYQLLNDDGVFLLVFTNTCYEKTGYQLDGEKEDNYIFWHKWQMEDIVPILAKSKLKPFVMRLQKAINSNSCDIYAEPFVFICKKERK